MMEADKIEEKNSRFSDQKQQTAFTATKRVQQEQQNMRFDRLMAQHIYVEGQPLHCELACEVQKQAMDLNICLYFVASC